MKPRLFISYSHRDEEWKDSLLRHLRVLQRRGALEIWDSSEIEPGSEWSKSIRDELFKCDIAILLVSPDALASDFIAEREIPALIRRNREGDLVVLPLHVRRSLWTEVPGLAELQFLNPASRPLAELSERERDEQLAEIAQRLGRLVQELSRREESGKFTSSRQVRGSLHNAQASFFISHAREDGDFAELLSLRMEREHLQGWIDVDRLSPGVDWRADIDDAIKKAPALIAVMSPEARASEYVTYEWAFAWGSDIPIIPLMLRPTSLHPRLATLQYLDFSNRNGRPWDALFDSLRKSLKKSTAGAVANKRSRRNGR